MGWHIGDGISAIGCGPAQALPGALAILTGVADAFEILLLSFIGPLVKCEWGCSKMEEGLLTSAVFVGMCIGSIGFAIASDAKHIGRRHSVIWATMLTFAAGFTSAFAPDIWSLVILRGLLGVGVSGSCLVPYTLFIESLPQRSRGFWASLSALAWPLGAISVVLMAWLILPHYGWRYLLVGASIPSGLCGIIALAFLDESPFLHELHGERDAALKALQKMARSNSSKLPNGELVLMHAEGSQQIKEHFSGMLLLCGRNVWWTTIGLWLVWFACSFCYYGTVMITTALAKDTVVDVGCKDISNGDWSDGDLAAAVFSTESYKSILNATWGEFAAWVVLALLIDRIGRLRTMSLSFLVFAASYAVLAAVAEQDTATDQAEKDDGGLSLPTLISLFFARTASAVAFGTAYTYTCEVFPTKHRSAGLATAYVSARLAGIVVPFAGEALFNESRVASAFLYVTVSLAAGIIPLTFAVETSGMRLVG